jgi:hypothetical protein
MMYSMLRLCLITAAAAALFAFSPISNVVKPDARASIPLFHR